MDAKIREVEEKDAEASCNVLRRSITECCAEDHDNDLSQLDSWLENKTPENFRNWISDPDNYAIVAESARNIIGVAMMRKSGDVTLCYLIPEARFKGVGKALLAQIEAKGRALRLGELRLNSTKTALQFYKRNGFESVVPPSPCHVIGCVPMVKALKIQ